MNTQDMINELELYIRAEFVPFSQSEGCKDPDKFALQKPNEPSINWRVTLYKGRDKVLQTPFRQGIGHLPGYKVYLSGNTVYEAEVIQEALETGIVPLSRGPAIAKPGKIPEPKIEDVLYSLLLDGAADFNAMDFEEWCDAYGHDVDSRKAFDTYETCLYIGHKLRYHLGWHIDDLLEAFSDY